MEEDKKTDHLHQTKSITDKIALVGELEHLRRHACRSMISTEIPENDRIFYAVIAERARELRRGLMEREFSDCPNALWCLGKCSAAIRQITYEIFDGDMDMVEELDTLIDMIWEKITGEDLSDCAGCREDKETKKTAE